MNCRTIEPLLFAERDGVLTAAQHASLEEHLATCPMCRQSRSALAETLQSIRADAAAVALPNVDDEWRTLRARIDRESAGPKKSRTLAPVWWFAAPLAAAAAIALSFFAGHPFLAPGETDSSADVASAEFVEAGDSDASTMVYVDKDSGWLVVWATNAQSEASG